MSALSEPQYHDEAAAFTFLESVIWANGVICPHCGVIGGRTYKLDGVRGKPSKRNTEGAIRYGLKKCGECRKQFTVKVGTVFEHARLPLHKMLQATLLLTSSKKGVSAHQLHRMLEIDYKSAWFLAHRIREAMRSGDLAVPFGSGGRPLRWTRRTSGTSRDSQSGLAWSQDEGDQPCGSRDGRGAILQLRPDDQHLRRAHRPRQHRAGGRLITDEALLYRRVGKSFSSHETVNHAKGEYGRGDVFTNTVEGSFSIFKRGMKGIYQHCGEQHLHRYLAEFDFRYSNRAKLGVNDKARAVTAVQGIVGKRLTYRTTGLHAEG